MDNGFAKFDLSGKTAFITGGGTGLGFSMARGLVSSGARVMIAARREDVLIEAVARLARGRDEKVACYRVMDQADEASIHAATEHANAELGGVDIFIGNAGIESQLPLLEHSMSTIGNLFQVNVFANMMLTQAFIPHMCKQQWGRIIYSSSVMARLVSARDGFSVYSSTKAALNAYARSAAAEVGHFGNVTVNSLDLGVYVTDMAEGAQELHDDGPALLADLTNMTALGRLGKPEELEGVAQWLASDAASYVSGASLVLDGGLLNTLRPNPRLTGGS